MSSVQQFSVCAKNIKELPSPFGEALLHAPSAFLTMLDLVRRLLFEN
jgi:hypothetical protein